MRQNGKFLRTIFGIGFAVCFISQASAQDWVERITSASPGSVVELPAGRHVMADVEVPAGVEVRGAGHRETWVDASAGSAGFVLSGEGAGLSGLTIRGAAGAGVRVIEGRGVSVSGVRVEDCLTGLSAQRSSELRVENCVLANNRTGAAFSQVSESVFVNNTLHNNGSLGLSVVKTNGLVAFNNIISNSVMGLFVEGLKDCVIDHNLYQVNYVGSTPGQVRTVTVQRMHALVGTSKHSVQYPIEYADAARGDFGPVTPMPWARHKPTTAYFARTSLAGVAAPAQDLDGTPRGEPQVGAVWVGDFEIDTPVHLLTLRHDPGVKSAGIFDTDGVLVSYLFHNLALPAGDYPYTWPTRDWQGRPIVPGTYELRVVESDLAMRYKGLVFNSGLSSHVKDRSPFSDVRYAAFAPDGRVLTGHGWSESHLQVRTFDRDYREAGWSATGSAEIFGLAVDGDEAVYTLTSPNKEGEAFIVTQRSLETGEPIPFAAGEGAAVVSGVFSKQPHGLAVLGDRLYVSDPGSSRLFVAARSLPVFDRAVTLDEPRSVVADPSIGRLWVIGANRELWCLNAEGGVVRSHELGFAIHQLAAAPGRLAVLSAETRKVHLFETQADGSLTPIHTVGSGEDRAGPFRDDTFTFQESSESKSTLANIALRDDGALLVLDPPRTLFYDAGGKLIRQTISVWGQHQAGGKLAGDDQPRWWNRNAQFSMKMDAEADTWSPDGVWVFDQPGLHHRPMIGVMTDAGRNFGLYRIDPKHMWQGIVAIEFDERYRGRSVVAWHIDKQRGNAWIKRIDSNGDGVIDENDEPGEPVAMVNGKPFSFGYDPRLIYPDGERNLRFSGRVGASGVGRLVRYTGLDDTGLPTFGWADAEVFHARNGDTEAAMVTSPFDFKTSEQINHRVGEFNTFPDGTVVFSATTKTGGGSGLAHVAGTDVAAASPGGRLRWFHPLPRTEGVHGIQIYDDILITQDFTDMDWYMLNPDGLGLGIHGIPPEMHWGGMWNDHPEQYRLYRGNDGKAYAILGDYVLTAYHHFALENEDAVHMHRRKVTLDPPVAASLEQQPGRPFPSKVEAPTFKLNIRKLDQPLPIDGDLAKWRNLGLAPQVLVTPETASGDITGPADLSVVIRLAHEGGNLYVQAIRFDDVVTMHQPLANHYKQDSLEVCINSFLEGFKFNVTRTREHGDTVYRDRFYPDDRWNRVFDPDVAPRVIRVLDDASAIEERELIESIYGLDLSGSRVIVTEFKLPMAEAFADDPAAGVAGRSGDQMWIGFMLGDNDQPGSDTQDLCVFPATYNTFAVKTKGALATFE